MICHALYNASCLLLSSVQLDEAGDQHLRFHGDGVYINMFTVAEPQRQKHCVRWEKKEEGK